MVEGAIYFSTHSQFPYIFSEDDAESRAFQADLSSAAPDWYLCGRIEVGYFACSDFAMGASSSMAIEVSCPHSF
jgi:hypothetical protein